MHEVQAKSILSAKNGMNLYRGCSHGCIYCDSRSKVYGMNHDFEDIEVKINAPELLEKALISKRKKVMIGTGAMSDPYLPLEKDLQLTRTCLEIIRDLGFGLSVLTKSDLILRDMDLLEEINRKAKCVVQMTLTTADESLCNKIEPNVCSTRERFAVLKEMRKEGIKTVVWFCPMLPWVNDTEENIQRILEGCADVGVSAVLCFGAGLTLREGNREFFYAKLDSLFPGLKNKYIAQYASAYVANSPNETRLMQFFRDSCYRLHLDNDSNAIFHSLAEFPAEKEIKQLRLF